jgi:hypothetical protein
MGLPVAKTFNDITPDAALASTLQQLYGNINNVDAYVGGLAEPHFQQAHVGQLFYLSIRDQFTRLRDGDFWYYENAANNKLFSAAEVDEIRRTREYEGAKMTCIVLSLAVVIPRRAIVCMAGFAVLPCSRGG